MEATNASRLVCFVVVSYHEYSLTPHPVLCLNPRPLNPRPLNPRPLNRSRRRRLQRRLRGSEKTRPAAAPRRAPRRRPRRCLLASRVRGGGRTAGRARVALHATPRLPGDGAFAAVPCRRCIAAALCLGAAPRHARRRDAAPANPVVRSVKTNLSKYWLCLHIAVAPTSASSLDADPCCSDLLERSAKPMRCGLFTVSVFQPTRITYRNHFPTTNMVDARTRCCCFWRWPSTPVHQPLPIPTKHPQTREDATKQTSRMARERRSAGEPKGLLGPRASLSRFVTPIRPSMRRADFDPSQMWEGGSQKPPLASHTTPPSWGEQQMR